VKKNVASPGEPLLPLPSAKIRMAGRSRIAFTMPADETELAFAIEAILDACRRWPMRLDVNAVADAPVYRLPGFAAHDEWLASVVSSPGWVQAVQELNRRARRHAGHAEIVLWRGSPCRDQSDRIHRIRHAIRTRNGYNTDFMRNQLSH
jgi:hypothetical protein